MRKKTDRKKPAGNSLRITHAKIRTTDELRQMLLSAVDKMASHGIARTRGFSLYVNPVDENGAPVVARFEGRQLRMIVMDGPYISMAEEKGL